MRALHCAVTLALLQAPVLAAQPASPPAEQLWSRLGDSVRAIAQQTDAITGLAILDLTDRRVIMHNGDNVFPTASTIKIAVLAELYRQHAGARTKLGDLYTLTATDLVGGSGLMRGFTPGVTRLTNRDLAVLMMGVSDNSATNILIGRLSMDSVNALLSRLGFRETRLRRLMMDAKAAEAGRENTATPRELVTLLWELQNGAWPDTSLKADFFKVFSTPKNGRIARLLPAGVAVADKPGELEGVRVDAGIVFVPGRPFAIAVMTNYGRDVRAQETVIARIARAAWDYFDVIARSSPLGRAIR
jgi:beta-lactamase class A